MVLLWRTAQQKERPLMDDDDDKTPQNVSTSRLPGFDQPAPPHRVGPSFGFPPFPPAGPPPNIEQVMRGVFADAVAGLKKEQAAAKRAEERSRARWFLYRMVVFVTCCGVVGWSLHISPGRAIAFGIAFMLGLGAVAGIATEHRSR